jgi:Chaperone of endosialidase
MTLHKNKAKNQSGYFMVGLSIALLAASLTVIGTAQVALNTWKENIGTGLGNQLQVINNALASYVVENSAQLIANSSITIPETAANVANIYSPTIAELQAFGYLSKAVLAAPTAGTAYVINVALQPAGCTAAACLPVGSVYLKDPLYGPDGKVADIRLLGAAADVSTTNQIGFSSLNGASSTAPTITGKGWSFANPDPKQRPGILYATTSLSTVANPQYWLKSAATYANLPLAGNSDGDGRYTLDTNKPYRWSSAANSWVEAFSNRASQAVSMGEKSGVPGQFDTYLGSYAGNTNKTGYQNVFLGAYAGSSNTSGNNNQFIGYRAGLRNTTGYNNIFAGVNAGANNTVGNHNVFIGVQSGYSNQYGYSNVFLGPNSGYSNVTGNSNVSIGDNAGLSNISGNTTGNNNIFSGTYAGHKNKTGYQNIFSGVQSGFVFDGGWNNIFLGVNSGAATTWSQDNVFVGSHSGEGNINGIKNTYIGTRTGSTGNFTNATAIGYGASAVASNAVRIGNGDVSYIGGQVAWSNASDRRLKKDVKDSQRGLEFVNQLRSVDYVLKSSNKSETGFIAQEVEGIDPSFPGVIKPAHDQDYYSLTYTDFIPSIVKSIQELDGRTRGMSSAPSLHTQFIIAAFGSLLALMFGLLVFLLRENRSIKLQLAEMRNKFA